MLAPLDSPARRILATGVALVALGHGHGPLLAAHKASFVVFIVVTGAHVLAYAVRMAGLAVGELRPRRDARLRGEEVEVRLAELVSGARRCHSCSRAYLWAANGSPGQ